jgi:hypothetical protein
VLAGLAVILLLIRGIPLIKVNFRRLRERLASASILLRRLGVLAALIQGIPLLHSLVRGRCLPQHWQAQDEEEAQ